MKKNMEKRGGPVNGKKYEKRGGVLKI